MGRDFSIFVLVFFLCLGAYGQQGRSQKKPPPPNQAPPRSDSSASANSASPTESSSKSTDVDISPPKDDAQKHPSSASGVAEAAGEDVQEFHPWDPHRAMKDIEVGDFYLKRKNYPAAENRYREALLYKPNDAIATYRLGQTLEKMGHSDEARLNYEGYLKILPEGPLAVDAHKALERLQRKESKSDAAEKR